MHYMNSADGSIFVLGMPLIFIFSIGAIKATDYNKKRTENLLITIGAILLFFYYYCVFNPNTILTYVGTLLTLGYYVGTFIACKKLF